MEAGAFEHYAGRRYEAFNVPAAFGALWERLVLYALFHLEYSAVHALIIVKWHGVYHQWTATERTARSLDRFHTSQVAYEGIGDVYGPVRRLIVLKDRGERASHGQPGPVQSMHVFRF
jgi:hypothetical protein